MKKTLLNAAAYVGLGLLVAVLAVGLGFGSNAAFDALTSKFDGSCLRIDSDAQLCVNRDSLPEPTL